MTILGGSDKAAANIPEKKDVGPLRFPIWNLFGIYSATLKIVFKGAQK